MSDDDVLTILAIKEKPSTLDFRGHQEVMIKCGQEQSMKRIAELLQERRRARRTIVEYSIKRSPEQWSSGKRTLPSGRVVAHHAFRSHGEDKCKRECEITAGAVVGETLRVEFDTVCHWCWRANSFQATT